MLFFMNPPKCNEYDYINFLTAAPKVFSCTEAEKVQPDYECGPSHIGHKEELETLLSWNFQSFTTVKLSTV